MARGACLFPFGPAVSGKWGEGFAGLKRYHHHRYSSRALIGLDRTKHRRSKRLKRLPPHQAQGDKVRSAANAKFNLGKANFSFEPHALGAGSIVAEEPRRLTEWCVESLSQKTAD